MQRGENLFVDYHLNHVSLRGENSKIAVILAGDETLNELGSWPLPREIYAKLLCGRLSKADTIILDILFSEESDANGDLQLQKAIGEHGSVVLANVAQTDIHYAIQPLTGLEQESAAVGYT